MNRAQWETLQFENRVKRVVKIRKLLDDGKNYVEIAEIMSLSRQRVQQLSNSFGLKSKGKTKTWHTTKRRRWYNG